MVNRINNELIKLLRSAINLPNELKGGNEGMETKSRYEVIADLEQQKRSLIRERDSFPDKVREMEKEIKETKRELEDNVESLKHLKETQKGECQR